MSNRGPKVAGGVGLWLALAASAPAALDWVGHVTFCPQAGFVEPTDDVWINAESRPAGQAQGARVVVSTNDGVTWTSLAMSLNGQLGVHDWWHVNLGPHPAGTVLRFAVEVTNATQSLWDTNGGQDYRAKINGGATFLWIGQTRHTPPHPDVDVGEPVTVWIESFPIGSATTARVVFSSDGFNWTSVDMAKTGTVGQNDLWQAGLGSFAAGSTNRYAVEVKFGTNEVWDTNNGANFPLVVNSPYLNQWVGNTGHTPVNSDVDPAEAVTITTASRPLTKGVSARVFYSTNGVDWQTAPLTWSGAQTSNDLWTGSIGGFSAEARVRYAVEVDFGFGGKTWDSSGGTNYLAIVNPAGPPAPWIGNTTTYPLQGDIDPGDDVWVNAQTRPLGDALSALVVYSTNAGVTWMSSNMSHNGTSGDKDLWHVNLGQFPAGTTNRFALQATFAATSVWDNANGTDYWVVVNAPKALARVLNSASYPDYGSIDPGEDVWINTETEPAGAATNARALYTTDGTNWMWATMVTNGTQNGRSLWHVNLGPHPAGTTLRFVVQAVDAYGHVAWDNNYGEDYYTRVSSAIRDLYTDKARYNPGDPAVISTELFNASGSPISGVLRVHFSHLFAELGVVESNVTLAAGAGLTVNLPWTNRYDDFRGYAVDADWVVGGVTNDRRSTAIDVSTDWTRYPRYGFFSDFYAAEQAADSAAKAKELSKYHISAVQFYDWMWEHDRLMPYTCDGLLPSVFEGLLGGEKSLVTISNKIAAAKSRNMFTMAYDLIYGDSGFGSSPLHPKWAAYNKPWVADPIDIHQHPLIGFNPPRAIWVMDCSNADWQRWIFNQYADAMLKLGFEGIHLDNLGGAWTYKINSNDGIPEGAAFPAFINACRAEIRNMNPAARVIHNDVYAGYLDTIAPSSADVYYAEVWGYDRYRDVRDLILRARERGGGKQTVLAAYMNLDDYTNVLSEASVRLMDACTFANGAFHIELGEGVEMLSNHYFPQHWPPMPPTLKRAMRDDYDFIVKYENLLFFNTLGNVSDGTAAASVASASHALSKTGESGTIWTVVKVWRDEFDVLSLINLHGVDEIWRNRSARPQAQTNVQIKYYVDKVVTNVYVASPDDGLGRPEPLAFTQGVDGGGRFVAFTVPRLEYWDLVVVDKRSDIKVDGWPGDWTGAPPANVHEVTVDQGEWIYRGDTDDFRTFGGASADEDLTEVRLTCDETYAYFLVRMQNITNTALPAIGIAWNSHLGGGSFPWIGDASKPSGSIGLEHSDQYATRQIMVYSAGGTPKIRLFNGTLWYVPNAQDSAVSVSPDNDCVEFRVNRNDLDLILPQKVTLSLVTFRSSGSDAGSDATFDSPDNNNDAVDVMGGDPGISDNAWGRDLSDNNIGRHYQVLFNQQGADAQIRIAWPNFDGQRIDLLTNEAYIVVAQFTEALPAATNDFLFSVNGVTQQPGGCFFQDELPGDLQNEIRFPWSDTGSGMRTVRVEYAASGFHLTASRVANLNPDTDGDGIRDALEDVNRNERFDSPLETSFTNVETDGDGLADGFEDGNRDGRITGDANNNYLHDAGEQWWETDPRRADTDGDGLPDGWEVGHGLTPWNDGVPGHTNMNSGLVITNESQGAEGDPDLDGMSNASEYLAGTHPLDAGSVLRLDLLSPLSGGVWVITWPSVSGRIYRLYSTTSAEGPYLPLSGDLPASNTVTSYQDTNAAARRFIQLRVVAP